MPRENLGSAANRENNRLGAPRGGHRRVRACCWPGKRMRSLSWAWTDAQSCGPRRHVTRPWRAEGTLRPEMCGPRSRCPRGHRAAWSSFLLPQSLVSAADRGWTGAGAAIAGALVPAATPVHTAGLGGTKFRGGAGDPDISCPPQCAVQKARDTAKRDQTPREPLPVSFSVSVSELLRRPQG